MDIFYYMGRLLTVCSGNEANPLEMLREQHATRNELLLLAVEESKLHKSKP